MGLITFSQKGDFNKTERFLKKNKNLYLDKILEKYAKLGVQALSDATPVDTGLTSESWYYEIEKNKSGIKISFNNSNIVNGVPIAIILQYGHGTGTGGYVAGIDYINPAIRPIFKNLADDIWKEVTT